MTCFKALALGASALAFSTTASAAVSFVSNGFDGIDLAQAIGLGQGFIPPDTMGAVGTTQYASILNGGFAVYNKATGAELLAQSTNTFWQNAGATNFGGNYTNGDPRILFNANLNRWVATAFGGDVSFLNIAVSDTADATGPWRATTFLAFNGASGGGVADYATLAMDRNAVYVGTNDFDPGFVGSTLNVIPLSDVFGAGAPDVTNRATFLARAPFATDYGYAIQAANSDSASTNGWIVADGITSNGVGYDIDNAALGAGGATRGAVTILSGQADVTQNGDARQPDGTRDLDALDTRISGGAYEYNGKLYFTRTITRTGEDYTVTRVTVLNANDYSLAQQFDIDAGDFDYYQSAIAVNANGAVINYNRSGFQQGVGNISVLANAYTLDANGLLVFDAEYVLKVSENDGYHLGSPRNRWGDYAQVTIDPTDPTKFWSIGEYANFRNAQGGDGWATWISEITFRQAVGAIPEPATWAQMLLGFGLIGGAIRRKRVNRVTYSVA